MAFRNDRLNFESALCLSLMGLSCFALAGETRRCDTTRIGPDTYVKCSSRYENGVLSGSIKYKNGKMEDTAWSYFRSGRVRTIEPYRNGRTHGTLIQYDSTGRMKMREHHFEGHSVGVEESWYPSGQTATRVHYDSTGLQDGKYEEWFENGKKFIDADYARGKDLKKIVFREDGKLFYMETRDTTNHLRDAQYFDLQGKPSGKVENGVGTYRKYYPDGKIEERIWKDGRPAKFTIIR